MAVARRRRPRRSPLTIGLIALVIILIATFLGFTKDIPFTHGYVLKAQFESANNIRVNSPVRIAGVEVGKVKKVEPLQGTNAAVLVRDLKKDALVPQHSHHNEQLTYIVEGALKFWIDGQEIVVHAGEVLCIPSNMPHKAEAMEDTVDLDIFSPPRADWINKTDQYLRKDK